MTLQAISPRLATRILLKFIRVAHFGGRFSAKARRPSPASGPRRASANLSAAKSSTDEQILRADPHHDCLVSALAIGAHLSICFSTSSSLASSSAVSLHQIMRDAEAQRLGALEARRGQREVARLRHADAGGDEGRDLGRHDADRGLAHGKARALGADRHVGDADQAEAAGDGITLDRGHDDLRRGVDRLEEGAESAIVETAIGSFSPGFGLSPKLCSMFLRSAPAQKVPPAPRRITTLMSRRSRRIRNTVRSSPISVGIERVLHLAAG